MAAEEVTRMVQRGELPEAWESLQRELDSDPPSFGRLRP